MVDAVTRNHYREVQQPVWERLAEERLRVVEAKEKISGACYMTLAQLGILGVLVIEAQTLLYGKSVLHCSNSTTQQGTHVA